ncbi:MAG: hypothetical protein IPK25_09460 [Saprospiraceae bacterium]|nr:hypothetical protein [Saprospiraceae bacterium]
MGRANKQEAELTLFTATLYGRDFQFVNISCQRRSNFTADRRHIEVVEAGEPASTVNGATGQQNDQPQCNQR